MISVAGLHIEIAPKREISEAELRFISRFATPSKQRQPDITITLESIALRDRLELTNDDPVRVEWQDGCLRLAHSFIDAIIPVPDGDVVLRRDRSHATALHLALRTAVAARLPTARALPLHAAGIVVDGLAVVLFGPSGAGKSTVAARAVAPVLSDEFVVVHVDTLEASSAGFWGELDRSEAPRGRHPLGALVELAKGSPLELTLQSAEETRRKLVASLLVPPAPELWSAAIALTDRLVRRARTARLQWSLDDSPWIEIDRLLGTRD